MIKLPKDVTPDQVAYALYDNIIWLFMPDGTMYEGCQPSDTESGRAHPMQHNENLWIVMDYDEIVYAFRKEKDNWVPYQVSLYHETYYHPEIRNEIVDLNGKRYTFYRDKLNTIEEEDAEDILKFVKEIENSCVPY